MNLALFKYQIPMKDFMRPGQHNVLISTLVDMPVGAEVISVEAQGDDLCCWALVDHHTPHKTVRRFALLATGVILNPVAAKMLKDEYVFKSTVLFGDGIFVLHVYEGIVK